MNWRRRRLGASLRELRDAAGVGAETAATELGCGTSKISHIETGRNAPRKTELKALLGLYRAAPELYATLEELRVAANERGWWSTFKLPTWFSSFIGLEVGARTARSFDGEVIQALLQTEDYNRATHAAAAHMVRPDEIDRQVEVRRRRIQRLNDHDPLSLQALLSEAALHRALALGTVGVEQLRHLITMAERDNVVLRVLPLAAGLHASLSGSFVVLSFDDDVAPPAAYLENAAGGHIADEPAVVTALTQAWETLRAQALTETQSITLINHLLTERHRAGDLDFRGEAARVGRGRPAR